MSSRARQARGALSYFLSLSWAYQPNKALWLCSASCSLAFGYLSFSNSARPVFLFENCISLLTLSFACLFSEGSMLSSDFTIQMWSVMSEWLLPATWKVLPYTVLSIMNLSLDLSHWFRHRTHDPVTSPKPFLWTLYWTTSHFISKLWTM